MVGGSDVHNRSDGSEADAARTLGPHTMWMKIDNMNEAKDLLKMLHTGWETSEKGRG